MQKSLFITSTGFDVGKTVVTLAIAAYYQTYCSEQSSVAVYKPISSDLTDPKQYQTTLNLPHPLEELSTVSVEGEGEPSIMAACMNSSLNLATIWKHYQALSASHDLVLMEAFGGLGTPLTPETTVADLAWDWRLPTFLVVPVHPGAIGQAIAHVALARQSRVHLKGLILTCPTAVSQDDIKTFKDLLQSLTQVPTLGCVPYLADLGDRTKLAHAASNLDIERILPFL